MKIDLNILNKYKKDGWLINQQHPTLPLTIWNYSHKTQFDKYWDNITIMCRGLITDNETGEIVALPFKKFWNIEEKMHKATPNFKVFKKMDGSLIILFNYKNEWIIASRGSFISEQALKAIEMLHNKNLLELDKNYTYLFEIIY